MITRSCSLIFKADNVAKSNPNGGFLFEGCRLSEISEVSGIKFNLCLGRVELRKQALFRNIQVLVKRRNGTNEGSI